MKGCKNTRVRLLTVIVAKRLITGFLLLSSFVVAFGQSGYLDTNFGISGKTVFPVGTENDIVTDMAIDGSGSIYLAGYSSNGTDYDFTVAKVTSAGNLDLTFNSTGKLMLPIGTGDDYGDDIVLDESGNVYISGYYDNGTSMEDVAVVKIKPDGTLDNTFGLNGIARIHYSNSSDYASDMAIDGTGNLFVGGHTYFGAVIHFTVTKLTSTGSLDLTFGGGGFWGFPYDEGDGISKSILVKSNGDIYLGCTVIESDPVYDIDYMFLNKVHPFILQIKPSGGGIIERPMSEECWWCNTSVAAMAFDQDENVLVAGNLSKHFLSNSYYDSEDTDLSLARFFPNRSRDADFGTSGTFVSPVGSYEDKCFDITVDSEGKIYMAGYFDTQDGVEADFMAVRLLPNGTLDKTFSQDGKIMFPIGSSEDICTSIKTDELGNVYMAGHMNNGTDYDFTLVKLSAEVITDVSHAMEETGVLLYPNPSNGMLHVNTEDVIKQVVVTNVLGQREVFYSSSFKTSYSGLLTVEIATNRTVVKQKILVE